MVTWHICCCFVHPPHGRYHSSRRGRDFRSPEMQLCHPEFRDFMIFHGRASHGKMLCQADRIGFRGDEMGGEASGMPPAGFEGPSNSQVMSVTPWLSNNSSNNSSNSSSLRTPERTQRRKSSAEYSVAGQRLKTLAWWVTY